MAGVFTSGSTDTLKACDYEDQFCSDRAQYFVEAEDNELKISLHRHDFSYAAGTGEDTDKITATCTSTDGECSLADHKVTLTLLGPAGNLTYDGLARTASVSGYPLIVVPGLEPAPMSIVYYRSEGAGSTVASGSALESAPTEAGDYVAQITWGEQNALKAFTIDRRSVTLTSASAEKEYDGDALTREEVTVGGDGFVKGEGTAYDVTGTRTVAGISENDFTYSLNEGTKASNYSIDVVKGTLTVKNRNAKYKVALRANSGTAKYDGKEKSVAGYTVSGKADGEFAEGDSFRAANGKDYTISGMSAGARGTNAGTYVVNVTGMPVIKDSEGNDVSAQFGVSAEPGSLVIGRRSITMTSASATKVYDGSPLTRDEVTVGGDGFVKGEGAFYAVTGTQTEPGASQNTFTYTLTQGTTAGNYEIASPVFGTLTVKPGTKPSDPGKDGSEGAGSDKSGSSKSGGDKKPSKSDQEKEAKKASERETKSSLGTETGNQMDETGLTLTWGRVSGANRYEVYAEQCGHFKWQKVGTLKSGKVTRLTIRKLHGKKLDLKKNYKYYVVASKVKGKKKTVLGKSVISHVVGSKNPKYTNVKAIVLKTKKLSVKVGKSKKIKAKVTLVDPKKKRLPASHVPVFRYMSSNPKIAKVVKGKVTGKKAGKCYVWIYSGNGHAKKVKVTVKK